MSGSIYLLLAAQLASVDAIVSQHELTLKRIQSIHCVINVQESKATARYEMWSTPEFTRTLQRNTDLRDSPEATIRQDWYSATEGRTLRGWDPDAPFELPLDYARRARQFGQVFGVIGPVRAAGARSHAWFQMGLDVVPGWSLPDLAGVTQFTADSNDAGDPVLHVSQSQLSYLQGLKITLSREHGSLIRKLEFPQQMGSMEVQEFAVLNGSTVPALIKRRQGADSTTATVESCKVNQPIDAELLTLEFPAGARIDDNGTGQIHLWGTDAPALTFDTRADYDKHLTSSAHVVQWKPHPVAVRPLNPLFWINLVFLAVIAVLALVRLKLRQRTS